MAADVDIRSVLLTNWVATPWDYNSLYRLEFNHDGSGKLLLAYGQSINAIVAHRFEIKPPDLIRLMYVDVISPWDYLKQSPYWSPPSRHEELEILREYMEHPWLKLFEAEFNVWRDFRFELKEGDFRGDQNVGDGAGPFRYNFRWLLKFDAPPYPKGINTISGDLLEFYGHGTP